MPPPRILTCICLAAIPLACGATIDEQKILELAELDARSFCLSYLPKCDYRIQSLGKPDGSNAAWVVFVSHVVMVDKWKLFPPGSSELQIVYDEDGQVVSDNKDRIPLRTEATTRVGFQQFCSDGLDQAGVSLQPITRKKICSCAADKALTHKMVADTFELRREDWPEEMKSQKSKAFVGDIIANAIGTCVQSETAER